MELNNSQQHLCWRTNSPLIFLSLTALCWSLNSLSRVADTNWSYRLKLWGYSPFWLLVKRISPKNIKQRPVFQTSALCLGLAIDITDSFIIPLKHPRLSPGISFPPSPLLESRKSHLSKVELDPQFLPLGVPSKKRLFSPQAFMLDSRNLFSTQPPAWV